MITLYFYFSGDENEDEKKNVKTNDENVVEKDSG